MTFFEKVHQIFQSALSTQITIIDFMKFIFNDTKDTEDNVLLLENRAYYRYYNGSSGMSPKTQELLHSIKVRNFDYFFSAELQNHPDSLSILHSELQALCQTYKLSTAGLNTNELLNELVDLYIQSISKIQPAPSKPFIPAFKIKRPRLCESFCRHQSEKEIVASLKQNRILFLYSLPGTGKTEFANNLQLHYRDYHFKDTFSIPYTESLQCSLQRIDYQLTPAKRAIVSSKELSSYIKRKGPESLLIINKMDPESVQDNYEKLSELHLTILITVDALEFPEQLPKYKFPSLSFESLYYIFTSAYGQEISPQVAKQVFTRLENHVLTIRLLGKSLKKTNSNGSDYLLEISTTPLKQINFPEIKYRKEKIRFFPYLHQLIKKYNNCFDANIIPELQMISLFQGNEMGLTLFQELFPNIFKNQLSSLVESEILIYADTDSNIIRIHRLIAEVVQADIDFTNILSETHSPNIYRLLQKMINTIENIWTKGYSANQIQDLSFSLFLSLSSHHIRFNTNKKQDHFSKQGNLWLDYCLKCVHFYQEYGNTVYAETILNTLLDEYAGLPVSPLLILEKKFYQINCSWQANKLPTDRAQVLFDDIIHLLQSCNENKQYDLLLTYIINTSHLILDNLNIVLQRMISEIKLAGLDYEEQKKATQDFYTIYEQTYVPIILFIETNILKEFHNEWNIIYYRMWLTPLNQVIPCIKNLLECKMDSIYRLQLLSDAIYFYAQMFLSSGKSSYFASLTEHYQEMEKIYSTSRNIPSYIKDSYGIAVLYYGICHAVYDENDTQILVQTLNEMPEIYNEMVRLKDSRTYDELKSAINKILSDLTCQ
ncbi:MAG: hypothetical protein SPF46_08950 [Blautia sp.]|nr:hypothetical protein [Blautia sp.]